MSSESQSEHSATLTLSSNGSKALTKGGEELLNVSGVRTYYNLPLIKKAHWKWEVVLKPRQWIGNGVGQ